MPKINNNTGNGKTRVSRPNSSLGFVPPEGIFKRHIQRKLKEYEKILNSPNEYTSEAALYIELSYIYLCLKGYVECTTNVHEVLIQKSLIEYDTDPYDLGKYYDTKKPNIFAPGTFKDPHLKLEIMNKIRSISTQCNAWIVTASGRPKKCVMNSGTFSDDKMVGKLLIGRRLTNLIPESYLTGWTLLASWGDETEYFRKNYINGSIGSDGFVNIMFPQEEHYTFKESKRNRNVAVKHFKIKAAKEGQIARLGTLTLKFTIPSRDVLYMLSATNDSYRISEIIENMCLPFHTNGISSLDNYQYFFEQQNIIEEGVKAVLARQRNFKKFINGDPIIINRDPERHLKWGFLSLGLTLVIDDDMLASALVVKKMIELRWKGVGNPTIKK